MWLLIHNDIKTRCILQILILGHESINNNISYYIWASAYYISLLIYHTKEDSFFEFW